MAFDNKESLKILKEKTEIVNWKKKKETVRWQKEKKDKKTHRKLKFVGEIRYFERVSSSCPNSDTRHVTGKAHQYALKYTNNIA